jgi:hypothetical protein
MVPIVWFRPNYQRHAPISSGSVAGIDLFMNDVPAMRRQSVDARARFINHGPLPVFDFRLYKFMILTNQLKIIVLTHDRWHG